MPSLKHLRDRLKSVQQIEKITSAMKMVASARFKKAIEHLDTGRIYTEAFTTCCKDFVTSGEDLSDAKPFLDGYPNSHKGLHVVIAADRGLCGNFNAALIKTAKNNIKLSSTHQDILTIGEKSRDAFKGQWKESFDNWTKDPDLLSLSEKIGEKILYLFHENKYQRIILVSGYFKNILYQLPKVITLVPFSFTSDATAQPHAPYLLDQPVSQLFSTFAQHMVTIQIYHALLETLACEHAARMTAMDNATRNAKDMMKKLRLYYNRSRQTAITNELIEIISGAQALGKHS